MPNGAPTETEMILKEIGDIKSFMDKKVEDGLKPTRDEFARMGKGLDDVLKDVKKLRLERASRHEDGRLRVPNGKYAGYDFLDLRIAESIIMRRVAARKGKGEWVERLQEARKSLESMIDVDSVLKWEDGVRGRFDKAFPSAGTFKARVAAADKVTAWRSALVTMVTKALDSTTAGSGDELVPTFEAAELWMDVNLDTLILPLLQQITMPTNPFDVPLQLGDTNWYPSTENVQVTTTDPATAKNTITAYGLKTGVPFSDEVEEDAIIALVPEIRRSLVRNAAEVIDDVLLNADTTVTNGINSDGATIAASTAGKAQWLLGFDGLLHQGIIDNTAMLVNNNGAAVSTAMYNKALRTLGKYASGRRPGEVVFVGDVNTVLATLDISSLRDKNTAGDRFTLSSGEVGAIFGTPLIRSEQMRLADNDGKVTDSGNSTSTGRILAFNTSQWRVGFRRQIEMETDREPGKGQTTLYVSFRIGLVARGTRSSNGHTVVVRNIGSVT